MCKKSQDLEGNFLLKLPYFDNKRLLKEKVCPSKFSFSFSSVYKVFYLI